MAGSLMIFQGILKYPGHGIFCLCAGAAVDLIKHYFLSPLKLISTRTGSFPSSSRLIRNFLEKLVAETFSCKALRRSYR